MKAHELLDILACGEDSRHQFKENISNADALAAELSAFANSVGGALYIGVADDGSIKGLSLSDIGRLNQLLSNVASNNIKPPIHPISTNIKTEHGLVMVVEVAEGLNKPYIDAQGKIWVKSGADKRHVTAREEMQRMFQTAGLVYADEVPVPSATAEQLDQTAFNRYFEKRYRKTLQETGQTLAQLLQNLNLARNGTPTLAGLLLFGSNPQLLKPTLVIKAVAFPGTVLHDNRYLDSEDIDGNLLEQYRRGMAFIKRNLRHLQGTQGFNSQGLLEIPEEVFEELLVNALVHRDYFLSAPIRLLIFSDRIELISPGHLPNHLDADQIRYGLSNLRNPALASHAFQILPYRGLGSGIPRATKAWIGITLIDDRISNQFKAIIQRPDLPELEMQPESRPESEQISAERPESRPESEQISTERPESRPESEQISAERPESRPESEQISTERPESRPESDQISTERPESRPESDSLSERVLHVLQAEPLSKTAIALALGHRSVSGQLNKTIRALLIGQAIEMTLPDTPKSRLQKYRLVISKQK